MGTGATSTNVPQNQYTSQAATSGYNAVQGFGALPNYALDANNSYTPSVYGGNIFDTTTFSPQSLVNSGNTIESQAPNLYGYGNTAFDIGADPLGQEYSYYSGLVQDAQNAENANAGIAATPYGAYVTDAANNNFTNQWYTTLASNAAQGANAAANDYSTAGNQLATGGALASSAPTLQANELTSLLSALMQNYTQPQQNVSNQLGYINAATGQNNSAVASANQQNQAAYLNSPLAFLGALAGSGVGQGIGKSIGTSVGNFITSA